MSLHIERSTIKDIIIIHATKHEDDRGFFSETYNKSKLKECGVATDFVQDNHSFSRNKGTVRGLHFQKPPFDQIKLVRVARGAIFDVAVDLRLGSPTYGKHVSAILSAEHWGQILIPSGFAHGFMTLLPNTEVLYKVSNTYSPEHDGGVLWNDPDLAIKWPFNEAGAQLSAKDRRHPKLADLEPVFHCAGETTQ